MNKTGFGFLRLPRLNPSDERSIDYKTLCSLVDQFLEQGGDYFDTAYTYLGGASEEALRKTLVERYPRERFRLADKLPGYAAKSREDNRTFLEESLKRCGVDYFDVYLLHGLNEENYEIAKKFSQFEFLNRAKAEGKARQIGFSFHDTADVLDRILTEQPQVDYVQLQINYLDWNSLSVQSRACYETAVRHGKRILVMEPVKGGSLAKLPEQAEKLLKQERPADSIPRWAMRFSSGLEHVEIVLSGMNSMEQLSDNQGHMEPLSKEEVLLLERAAEIIREKTAISCTACGYCMEQCPVHMPIPLYFELYNEYYCYPSELWKSQAVYTSLSIAHVPTMECVACGQCENRCPQKLPIMKWLQKVGTVLQE